jgi:hypothetical protein
MSNLEKRLGHKIRCKLNAVGGPDLNIRKGFTCWEAPTTHTVTAEHDNPVRLTEIRAAFIASIEAEGYTKAGGLANNRWLLEQDGKFIYFHISEITDTIREDHFDVTPAVYNVAQR